MDGMIDTPEIVTTTPQHFAGIRLLIPSSEIREHMQAGCREIAAALVAQGIAPQPYDRELGQLPLVHASFSPAQRHVRL